MRPRMYGSTDMYVLRTSTWPSEGAGSSTRASEKLSADGQPLGREASRISRDVIGGLYGGTRSAHVGRRVGRIVAVALLLFLIGLLSGTGLPAPQQLPPVV